MKDYLELCLTGESTIVPRKEMLAKKQERLRQTIKELEDSIAYIDRKQNFYDHREKLLAFPGDLFPWSWW